MIIAVKRDTGELYSYKPNRSTNISQFVFASVDEFYGCACEDSGLDNYLLFEVNKIYKPNVEFEEINYEDGEIY